MKNFAFIDSQNVHLAVSDQGWKLDWARFRVYLREKYFVEQAYLFIGFVDGNTQLYTELQQAGFICIFKPTLTYKTGTIKGNCEAELVLHTMIQKENFNQAVIVSGDGDFYCLVDYLIDQNKLCTLLIPNMYKYSALLKIQKFANYRNFISHLEKKVGKKK